MADVRVFSTPTCPWCHRAKDFLRQNNIKFEDIDVSVNEAAAREMISKTGQYGVPVIMIKKKDGKEEVIIGFDQKSILAALR